MLPSPATQLCRPMQSHNPLPMLKMQLLTVSPSRTPQNFFRLCERLGKADITTSFTSARVAVAVFARGQDAEGTWPQD